MTTTEKANTLIAKFIGLKLKSDKKTYELDEKISQILKCKTTQFLNFNENLELLFAVIEKISSIKDLWVNIQCDSNKVYVCLQYQSQYIEGEWRNAQFSCEREKPISKLKNAIFEVLSTFCGWYFDHPEFQKDIIYDFSYIQGESPNNVVYMEPKQVICPKCGKVYEVKK